MRQNENKKVADKNTLFCIKMSDNCIYVKQLKLKTKGKLLSYDENRQNRFNVILLQKIRKQQGSYA